MTDIDDELMSAYDRLSMKYKFVLKTIGEISDMLNESEIDVKKIKKTLSNTIKEINSK